MIRRYEEENFAKAAKEAWPALTADTVTPLTLDSLQSLTLAANALDFIEISIPQLDRRGSDSSASSSVYSDGPLTPSASPSRPALAKGNDYAATGTFSPTFQTKFALTAIASEPSSSFVTVKVPSAESPTLSRSDAPSGTRTPRGLHAPAGSRRPTRDEEEGARSRSRFPRLLWNSELDQSQLVVLQDFHVRTTGRALPQLDRAKGADGIRQFSRELERAGL